MDFKTPYLMALRAHAPALLIRLQLTDQLEAHLQEKANEATGLFRMLARRAPEPIAARRVMATLLVFPQQR